MQVRRASPISTQTIRQDVGPTNNAGTLPLKTTDRPLPVWLAGKADKSVCAWYGIPIATNSNPSSWAKRSQKTPYLHDSAPKTALPDTFSRSYFQEILAKPLTSQLAGSSKYRPELTS